jgi:hypothetical protein
MNNYETKMNLNAKQQHTWDALCEHMPRISVDTHDMGVGGGKWWNKCGAHLCNDDGTIRPEMRRIFVEVTNIVRNGRPIVCLYLKKGSADYYSVYTLFFELNEQGRAIRGHLQTAYSDYGTRIATKLANAVIDHVLELNKPTTPEPTDPTPRGTVTREPVKQSKPKAAKSSVIYRGPSLIDGAPIVAVAVVKSGNTKTGNMVQTYIIRDDVAPVEASRIGADRSVCGDCPHRGQSHDGSSGAKQALNRSCYVVLGQGPTGVFKANQKGNYPDALDHEARAAIGAGRMVRLGTYGDPAAVPSEVWDSLISEAVGHTAYSHQNGVAGADYRADLFMRSADTLDDALDAWSAGQRTFRVIASDAERIPEREVLCPASEEAGRRVTCEKCKLCAGSSIAAKSVAIVAHGAGATHFKGAA